jgi:hypothetical protein
MRRDIYVFSTKLGQPDVVFNVVQRSRNCLGFVAGCWVSRRQTEERCTGRARAGHGRGMRFAWSDIGSRDSVPLRVCALRLVCHGDWARNGHTFMYRRSGRNSSGHVEMTSNNRFKQCRGRIFGEPRRGSMTGINCLRLAPAQPSVTRPHRYASL